MPRALIDTTRDKRYVRRDGAGRFNEVDDVSRSLASDTRRKAKTKVPAGEGDRGDQKRATRSASGQRTTASKSGGKSRVSKKATAARSGAKRTAGKRATARTASSKTRKTAANAAGRRSSKSSGRRG